MVSRSDLIRLVMHSYVSECDLRLMDSHLVQYFCIVGSIYTTRTKSLVTFSSPEYSLRKHLVKDCLKEDAQVFDTCKLQYDAYMP